MTIEPTAEQRFSVRDKVVVITGCTGVLGSRYSEAFAEAGAKLVMADLPTAAPEQKARTLAQQYSAQVIGVHCDVTKEQQVQALFAQTLEQFGRVDVVHNNAAATGEHLMKAGNVFSPFEDYSLEMWQQVMRVNLDGVFLVAREGGKAMLQSGGGSMINVSSTYGVVGPDHRIYKDMPFSSFAPYSAAKAGIHGLTRWLATYWGEKQIRVNTLVPGGVYNNHHPDFVERYSNRTPMARMADSDDMVGMVLYLASDASRYCTGQQYFVDGGYTAW